MISLNSIIIAVSGFSFGFVTCDMINRRFKLTEKRFDCVLNEFDEIEYISDIVDCEDRDFPDFLDYVNEMAKENEELKKDIEYYKTERLALFEYIDKKDDLKLKLKVEK